MNASNAIALLVLFAAVAAVLWRNHRKGIPCESGGGSSCGCAGGCSGCSRAGGCAAAKLQAKRQAGAARGAR